MTETTIVLSFLAFFPVLWCAVSLIIGLIGGWSTLSGHYGSSDTPDHIEWQGWRSMVMRRAWWFPANYGSALKFGFDRDALYMRSNILFRLGHPDLRLPLADMSYESHERFMKKYLSVRMRSDPGIELCFYRQDKDRLLERLENR